MKMDGGVPAVQCLVESGVAEVPVRFVRPIQDRPAAAESLELDEVPVIDAAALVGEGPELNRLHEACREWGFFQLTGHGIPSSLLRSTRKAIEGFFMLPQAEKESYTGGGTRMGKEGYGRYFLPSDDTVLDWGDVFFHTVPPATIDWPANPPEYKQTIQSYVDQVKELMDKLLAALSRALNQKPSFFSDAFGPGATHSLRMNYYPPCPQPELVLGLSPHSDGVGVTVLLQDGVEGLQIKKNGQWKSVKSIPDSFVVNIGDLIEIMSNGTYKSVEHRAIVSSGKRRISAALFHSPGINMPLKPLIPGVQPIFREMTVKDFFIEYSSKALQGKDHLAFAKLQSF